MFYNKWYACLFALEAFYPLFLFYSVGTNNAHVFLLIQLCKCSQPLSYITTVFDTLCLVSVSLPFSFTLCPSPKVRRKHLHLTSKVDNVNYSIVFSSHTYWNLYL